MLYIVVVVAYVPGYVQISIQCSQDWSIANFENRTLLHVAYVILPACMAGTPFTALLGAHTSAPHWIHTWASPNESGWQLSRRH